MYGIVFKCNKEKKMNDLFDSIFREFAASGYNPEATYKMLNNFFSSNQFNKELITKEGLEELFTSKKEEYLVIYYSNLKGKIFFLKA
jgi:hypothetical protein